MTRTCLYCRHEQIIGKWLYFCGNSVPSEARVLVCPNCETDIHGIVHKDKRPVQIIKEILDFLYDQDRIRLIHHNED